MVETLRRVFPTRIYEGLLDLRGMGLHGQEWERRQEIINKLHQEALEQERSKKQPAEIFDYIKVGLAEEGIGWAEEEQVFAVNTDPENGIYPKLIVAKYPGYDSDPEAGGWEVYYEGEASERDKHPDYYYFRE